MKCKECEKEYTKYDNWYTEAHPSWKYCEKCIPDLHEYWVEEINF